MLDKMWVKCINILYDIKKSVKSIDAGSIISSEEDDILALIDDGYNKLEYFHLIETKYSVSLKLGTLLEEQKEDLTMKSLYARFSLYATLIGYLDSVIVKSTDMYQKLCEEKKDYSIFVAQKLASATSFRKIVLADYEYKSQEKGERHRNSVLAKFPAYEYFGNIINRSLASNDSTFSIGGLIQAYMEGFKRTDDIDIEEIMKYYQTRKKAYVDFCKKCEEDMAEAKYLIQRKNKRKNRQK